VVHSTRFAGRWNFWGDLAVETRLEAVVGVMYDDSIGQPIQEVDAGELRLPLGRASGADPWGLHQQIRHFGSSKTGIPPILVDEDPDAILEISDGVTRATRIAKLAPGQTVPIVVIGQYRRSRVDSSRVRERL
jgi:hypothetical protein